jgi:hypothetical protein
VKAFLIKIILFLLPVFVSLFFFELYLRNIPNDYKFKREQLLNNAEDLEVLILGSSHALADINPSFLSKKSFNLANSSQTLDLDYELLSKFIKSLPNLSYVIIPVSYFSLFNTMETEQEKFRIKNYILYYNIHSFKINLKYFFELTNGTIISNASRLYQYYKNNRDFITVSELGFGLNYSSAIKNNMEETAIAASERHNKEDWRYLDYNKSQIENIINLCQLQHICLIFVTMPAYSTYRKRLNSAQLGETINYMTNIAQKHSNLYYYNFLDDALFVEDDFFDADHLNEIGAKKFTIKLEQIINSIKTDKNT